MSEDNATQYGNKEKLRLNVEDLRPGMYVCELDRPWLETPFPLQGFELESDRAIAELTQYCQHVKIDLDRSKVDDLVIDMLPPGSILPKKESTFRLEALEQADSIRKQTTNLVKTLIDEFRYGLGPDWHLVQSAVSECLSLVLRDPKMMLFLVQLRNKEGLTGQEGFNACIYALVIGHLLGLDRRQLENLGVSGLLHDMGKASIPDEILNKTGKLTTEELSIIQTHSRAGRDILTGSGCMSTGIIDVAYGHHENLDGSGYPRGLQGDQLSVYCKIIGVVDKYDAITSTTAFRPARSHLKAVYILNNLVKENKIDGKMATLLFANLGVYPPGTLVELTSKEVGIVICSDPHHRHRPQILVVRDAQREARQYFIDLMENPVDHHGQPLRIAAVRRPGDFGIEPSQYFRLILQSL